MKQFGNFVLDTANECLWSGQSQISLQPKPFAVLRYMVDNAGRLITHKELLEALWPQTYVLPQVLRTYMLELRKILGDDPRQPRFIQTLPKRGYRFVAVILDTTQTESSTTIAEVAQLLGKAFRILNALDDAHQGIPSIREALIAVRASASASSLPAKIFDNFLTAD